MDTRTFLTKHGACREGAEWALSISNDMADVWDAMIEQPKHLWLIWTACRSCNPVFDDKTLRLLAVRIVRETPGVFALLTDERSREALIVAEKFANGEATGGQLRSAALDAREVASSCSATGRAAQAAMHVTRRDIPAWCVSQASWAAIEAAVCAAPPRERLKTTVTAKAAQVQMIADLGNPFRGKA